MHAPKVSVIICSYNHAAFIGAAIESILNQSFTDFELMITDDASTDGSADIIKSYHDPRIIPILRPVNIGLCRNFNLAVAQARGEYIAQLGSDDIFAPSKLARQIAILDEQPHTGVAFTHVEVIGADHLPYKRHPLKHMKHLFNQPNQTRHQWLATLFRNNCLSASSALMRRSALNTVGYYDERFAVLQDYDLWVRFCLAGYDLHIIQEELTYYRRLRRGTSLSAKSLSSYNQVRFEQSKLLQRFLAITTLEEFRAIFPTIPEAATAELMDFYLAFQALQMHTRTHRQFALNSLYDLLGDPVKASLLEATHNFTARDLSKLTRSNALGFPITWGEWLRNNVILPVALSLHDVLCGFIYRKNKLPVFLMRWFS